VKRAKRPPSMSSKGTSWVTFFSCQGDEDCVIFEGSLKGKVFELEVLTSIKKLLNDIEKENENIPPQKANLENVKLNL
jgi:hypothetical protein